MRAADIRARLSRPWQHGEAEDFRGITVTDPLDLSGLALAGVDFTGARFDGGITAVGARFDGLSWFGGCTFAAADFSNTLFVNDAGFDATAFRAPPSFHAVEFRGIARFDAAQVPGGDFRAMTCYGNAAFAGVQAGDADFSGSEFLGGFWAQSAQFDTAARFDATQVHGRLWLRGARIGAAPLTADHFGLTFGYVWT